MLTIFSTSVVSGEEKGREPARMARTVDCSWDFLDSGSEVVFVVAI